MRAFADLYPDLTAGLILVDASHPDQWVRWPTPHADRILEVSQRILGWLGWFGLLRALHLARGISAGLPARQAAELRAGAALPGFAATEAAQIRSWSVSREQLKAAAPLGDLPLAVLAVTEQPVGGELLTALQRELAELTENASFQVVQGASHESVISDREHARIVAATIGAVVQAATDRSPRVLMRQASRLLSDEGKDGVEDRRPRSLWVGIAGLAALLLVGIASVLAMSPTATAGSDAPGEAFSAARAMTHISAIADGPRPVGSAQHGEAKAYLLDQLGSLGWRTEVQESIGMFDFGADGTQSMPRSPT